MNNFIIAIKRFLSNKNTVTILGVFLSIGILYFGYNYRVKQAVQPIRMPYAKETIQPRTKITEDMVGYVDVPPARLKGSVIRDVRYIVNYYTQVNAVIPAGSLFYKDTVISFEELPDASLIDIPKGTVPYNFKVNMDTTYGNSIFPGSYIDVYFKGMDGNTLMVGKLIKNIKVLAVKDAKGQHVFENTEESRIPASLIFAAPYDITLLLRKAAYLKDYEVELIPVPKGGKLDSVPGAMTISNKAIESFITSKTANVPDDDLTPADETIQTTTDENNNDVTGEQ
jgi:hypothetical protein